MTVPDDMLYEVVDGKIVEKNGSRESSRSRTLLIGYLALFVRTHRLGRALGRVRFPHRSSQRTSSAGRMSPSSLMRGGRFTAASPMSPSGTWCPTWPSKSSAHPTRPIRSRKRSTNTSGGRQPGLGRLSAPAGSLHYASPTQIQVLQLGQELDGGDLVPGFRLPLAALFEDDAE